MRENVDRAKASPKRLGTGAGVDRQIELPAMPGQHDMGGRGAGAALGTARYMQPTFDMRRKTPGEIARVDGGMGTGRLARACVDS